MSIDRDLQLVIFGAVLVNRPRSAMANEHLKPDDFVGPLATLMREVLAESKGERRFADLPSVQSWARERGLQLRGDVMDAVFAAAHVQALAAAARRFYDAGQLAKAASTAEEARQFMISEAQRYERRTNGECKPCDPDGQSDARPRATADAGR